MCEKQIYRFDGKATETAIPEIDRKWLSSMMWHCLNNSRVQIHLSGDSLGPCIIPSFCHSGIGCEYYKKRL